MAADETPYDPLLVPAWHTAGLQALRDTLNVDLHVRNELIQFLYDEGLWDASRLSWDAAVARWNDCLNPGKAAFFKAAELWALMKRSGRHQLLLAMAEDLGYEVRRRPTEERRQAMLAQIQQTMAELTLATQHCVAALHAIDREEARARAPQVYHGAPPRFLADAPSSSDEPFAGGF